MSRFDRGLVVGKFAPLHKGHEALIEAALEHCRDVLVISYANPEPPGCEAARREAWLRSRFERARILVVSRGVPRDDDDPRVHRRFCADLAWKTLGTGVNVVFTGEEYGAGFAEELTRSFRSRVPSFPEVEHIRVDRSRIPVSGTAVRGDVHAHRAWLSPHVYASFVERICLLGGESTGKSTLTARLAAEFGTAHVGEYGRERWERKAGKLEFDDLEAIAQEQVRREDAAAPQAVRYLFCDTSPLTTLFYSRHLFGRASPEVVKLAERSYDVTVLCFPDFPHVQDGTREVAGFRLRQHDWYVSVLKERKVSYIEARGSMESRVSQVRAALQSRIENPESRISP